MKAALIPLALNELLGGWFEQFTLHKSPLKDSQDEEMHKATEWNQCCNIANKWKTRFHYLLIGKLRETYNDNS